MLKGLEKSLNFTQTCLYEHWHIIYMCSLTYIIVVCIKSYVDVFACFKDRFSDNVAQLLWFIVSLMNCIVCNVNTKLLRPFLEKEFS